MVFAFQSCYAQFVAMSGRTLQFLRYRKEKIDLRSLFIAVSFRSVSDMTWPWIRKHDRWCHGWSTREYGRGETLKCRGFFSSVREVNGFLVGLTIRRSIWPIAGKFLDRSKSVAWFYGWKCVVCFSREPRWLPTFCRFYFPSPSTSYNSLNNARNGSGFHMEQEEKTLYK